MLVTVDDAEVMEGTSQVQRPFGVPGEGLLSGGKKDGVRVPAGLELH